MESKIMFRGTRIQLLPFESKHWDTLARWFYDEQYKDFFRHYRVLTEEDFKAYPQVIGGEVFMIHSLETNEIIGFVQGACGIKKNKATYIGMLVDSAHQGKHLGSEAIPLFLEYLFNRQGYNKAVFEILESNESLKKVLEKNGCYKEGKLLQECFIDGKFVNELRYSISAYYFNKNKDRIGKEF